MKWASVFPFKKILRPTHFICELHFKESDILKYYIEIINGEEIKLPRGRWDLVANAMPHARTLQSPNSVTKNGNVCSKSLSESPLSNVTNSPSIRVNRGNCRIVTYVEQRKRKSLLQDFEEAASTANNNGELQDNSCSANEVEVISPPQLSSTISTCELPAGKAPFLINNATVSVGDCGNSYMDTCIAHDDETEIQGGVEQGQITETSLQLNPLIGSQTESFDSSYFIMDELSEPASKRSTIKRSNVVLKKICSCTKNCQHSRKLQYLRQRLNLKIKVIKDLKAKIKTLDVENTTLKEESEKFEALPPKQQLLLKEALRNCNVKSATGKRYSKDGLLDSLLLKIKSPSLYEFLRFNDYLPLPTVSTLNKNISNLNASFGFDEIVFETLKEKTANMGPNERRGMLLFDEMQISRHLDYRPREGRVIGRVDYGDVTHEAHSEKFGDHALVFLFQPHLGGWVQTIGTFCSSGATPAPVLTKLLLQAVIKLYQCHIIVDGVVCDGATGNRSTLKSLGMEASSKKELKNYFPHPCDELKKVYFFCDAPHLIKCCRNILVKQGMFLIPEGRVMHSHFCHLYIADINKETSLRVVPFMTEAHIQPNNFQKMSVRLAAQFFSDSTADGMEFYRNSVPALSDCDQTISFVRNINRLFDLLNARRAKDAIWKNNGDKIVELQNAFTWLINWESYIATLAKEEQCFFLTKQTCEGLKITIQSTIDLSQDLIASGLSYVLTGRFNQDPLEKTSVE